MTKELYNLTVWYIKAYCYYKDVHDELFDEAAHIGGIEYDKEKVQSFPTMACSTLSIISLGNLIHFCVVEGILGI